MHVYPVVSEVVERGYESNDPCIPPILRLDPLVGVGGVVLHVAQVEARLVPPCLLLCKPDQAF